MKTSKIAYKSPEIGYSKAERPIFLCKSKSNTLFVNIKIMSDKLKSTCQEKSDALKPCRLIFPIYLFFVFWITLIDRIPRNRRCMLQPFWEYRELLTSGRTLYWLGQIGGNLVMLLPLGFLLPVISKRLQHFIPVLLIALCLSVFIEVTQYFTGRGLCELDDVFHNTLGAAAGYVIWKKLFGGLRT